MNQKLKTKFQPPYGGMFVLDDKERGFCGFGTSFEMLLVNCAKWRRANAVPVGLGFEDELETAVCQKYPSECNWFDPTIPTVHRLTLNQVIGGTTVLLSILTEWAKFKLGIGEHPLVDQATANARAKTCSTCQYNVAFQGTCAGGCGPLLDIVRAIKAGRSTPHDAALKACSVCGCSTEAHVWPRMDLLDKGLNDETRAQFAKVPWCWKKLLQNGSS